MLMQDSSSSSSSSGSGLMSSSSSLLSSLIWSYLCNLLSLVWQKLVGTLALIGMTFFLETESAVLFEVIVGPTGPPWAAIDVIVLKLPLKVLCWIIFFFDYWLPFSPLCSVLLKFSLFAATATPKLIPMFTPNLWLDLDPNYFNFSMDYCELSINGFDFPLEPSFDFDYAIPLMPKFVWDWDCGDLFVEFILWNKFVWSFFIKL